MAKSESVTEEPYVSAKDTHLLAEVISISKGEYEALCCARILLRDELAMSVLGSFQLSPNVTDDHIRSVANSAYRLADAMLKARETPRQP